MTFFSLKKRIQLLCLIVFSISISGQVKDSAQTKPEEDNIKYPQLQIKGLFQARYLVGMTKDVDVNGLHHEDGSGTDNNFMLKYMRVTDQQTHRSCRIS